MEVPTQQVEELEHRLKQLVVELQLRQAEEEVHHYQHLKLVQDLHFTIEVDSILQVLFLLCLLIPHVSK